MIRYFDSAYIAKLYLNEAGSEPVRILAADLKAIACCAHGRVEVATGLMDILWGRAFVGWLFKRNWNR